MKKKRFQKKQILGFIKSYHARRRQEEREVTDEQLIKILQFGEYDESNPESTVLTYEGFRVYLSHDEEVIITVTAPDRPPSNPKTISKEDGLKIKEQIDQEYEEQLEKEERELTYEEYMKDWK